MTLSWYGVAPIVTLLVALPLGCSGSAEETCVERGALFSLSPTPMNVSPQFFTEVCFEGLTEENGCPIYSFRVIVDEVESSDTQIPQSIDVQYGGDPGKCSNVLKAELLLDERAYFLSRRR